MGMLKPHQLLVKSPCGKIWFHKGVSDEGGEKRGDWGEAGVLQPDREIDWVSIRKSRNIEKGSTQPERAAFE